MATEKPSEEERFAEWVVDGPLRYFASHRLLEDFPKGSEGYGGVMAAMLWMTTHGSVGWTGKDGRVSTNAAPRLRKSHIAWLKGDCIVIRNKEWEELKALFPNYRDDRGASSGH